jgi:Fic family protein
MPSRAEKMQINIPSYLHLSIFASFSVCKRKEKNMLSKSLFESYLSLLKVDIAAAMKKIEAKELSSRNFNFYTAVSAMSSSRIEGEAMEIDSYVKHKMQDIEYLPDLIEKPNDLFRAYEFAAASVLTKSNFLQAHIITTQHLLPEEWRGIVRTGNMVIMNHVSGRIQYEAAVAVIVKNEFDSFWNNLDELIKTEMSLEEVFYFAAFIHLVFVKIHPFNDGNGRTGRLLEKWFLASKLGVKAWYIASEYHYYQHLNDYYTNLARVGLFYDDLSYEKSVPFLLMLPDSLNQEEIK